MTNENYLAYMRKIIAPQSMYVAIMFVVAAYFTMAVASLGPVWLPVSSGSVLAVAWLGNKFAHNANLFRPGKKEPGDHSLHRVTKWLLVVDIIKMAIIAVAVVYTGGNDYMTIGIIVAVTGAVRDVIEPAVVETRDRLERDPDRWSTEHTSIMTVLREKSTSYQIAGKVVGAITGIVLFSVGGLTMPPVVVICVLLAGPIITTRELFLANRYLK